MKNKNDKDHAGPTADPAKQNISDNLNDIKPESNLDVKKESQPLEDVLGPGSMLGDIVKDIDHASPEVSDHVVKEKQIEQDKQDEPLQTYIPTDEKGNKFNPDIHRSDQNGDPVKTKKGTFALKPGKKADVLKDSDYTNGFSGGSTLGPNINNNDIDINNVDINMSIDKQNESFAKIGTLTAGQIRQFLGGETASSDEREYLESALKIWLDDTNIVVNPNVGLAIALGTFYLPLLNVPIEKNVLLQGGLKIYSYFTGASDQIPTEKQSNT